MQENPKSHMQVVPENTTPKLDFSSPSPSPNVTRIETLAVTAKAPKITEPVTQENKPYSPNEPLKRLTVEELRKRQEEIDRLIQEKLEKEKKAILFQILTVMKTYGISLDELVDALGGLKIKRKGVKAVPKYRDPATGALWSGRGKEPVWIRGKDREAFLIDKSSK